MGTYNLWIEAKIQVILIINYIFSLLETSVFCKNVLNFSHLSAISVSTYNFNYFHIYWVIGQQTENYTLKSMLCAYLCIQPPRTIFYWSRQPHLPFTYCVGEMLCLSIGIAESSNKILSKTNKYTTKTRKWSSITG